MRLMKNRFGEGTLYALYDVLHSMDGAMDGKYPKIYCECTACMSVYTDMLSYLSYTGCTPCFAKKNDKTVSDVIVLGCQVTDLAILNDIRTAERLHEENPNANVYMGGCLAQRFDIELPTFIKRLDVARVESSIIKENAKDFITWQKPFWINDDLGAGDYDNGNLFRNSTPIKIGAGCAGQCKYCTIRDTRGDSYERDAYMQVEEFVNAQGDIVFVADSPSVQQVKDWCHIAQRYKKPVSFRNLEPLTANECRVGLLNLSKSGLLKTLHVPIQSVNMMVLKAMNRNVGATMEYIEWSQELRKYGTKLATNIIIDYVVDGVQFQNMNKTFLDDCFDYYAWNPYFDGKWDRKKAEERFEKYIEKKD